jgi:hypothetical protein
MCANAHTRESGEAQYVAIENIRASKAPPMKGSAGQLPTMDPSADIDVLLEHMRMLPEPEALKFYSQLSPKLQWLVRQRATGQRRDAVIVYHAVTIGPCRRIAP